MMKRLLSLLLVVMITFSFLNVITVSATETKNDENTNTYEKEWKKDGQLVYPVMPDDEKWKDLSYQEALIACEFPRDYLVDISTNQLADLILDYPFLIDVLAFSTSDQCMNHFSQTSNMFKVLFERDDSLDILLKKFTELDVDYMSLLSDKKDINKQEVSKDYLKELFMQIYFAHNIDLMDCNQKELFKTEMGRKFDEKVDFTEQYTTGLIFYQMLQNENGSVEKELIPSNILFSSFEVKNIEDVKAGFTNGTFTPSGATKTNFNGAEVYIGIYTLYNKSVGCYKFKSDDFLPGEISTYNDLFDQAHQSWDRVHSCTKRYNCHSYAWINSSTSNMYWLNNPDYYASSSSFSYKGQNASSLSGDKIIINSSSSSSDEFGGTTYALHSVNVISGGSNSFTILTRSKVGSMGVYDASLSDMKVFYGGSSYKVYR